MPLSDLDLAKLCQAQYDGDDVFDNVAVSPEGDRVSIRLYPDCTAVVDEGSHNPMNWLENAVFIMDQIPDFAGVDRGFFVGMSESTALLLPFIPKNKPVYFTGHSRGAPRALIRAAQFIKQGYQVAATVFAAPRPGDAALADILAGITVRSYRNYRDFDEQDFVCDLPLPYPFGYVHPGNIITIDIPPAPDDKWGILARHHMFLYTKGLEVLQHG